MEPTRTPSPWVAAFAVAALLVLLLAGSMAALRSVVLTRLEAATTPLANSTQELASRLGQLETRLGALETAKTDTSALDAAHQELSATQAQLHDTNTQLAALQTRMETLELKTTPPAAAAPAPTPPAREAAPAAEASSPPAPITDAEAMQRLHGILVALPTPATSDSGMLQSLNQRLSGLISIHKTSASDPYAAVRAAHEPAQAEAAIRDLSEAQRTPFSAWMAEREAARTPRAGGVK